METIPVNELTKVIRQIANEKHTGSLTVNFSQGSPSGTAQWKSKNVRSVEPDVPRGTLSGRMRETIPATNVLTSKSK